MSNMNKAFKAKGLAEAHKYCEGTAMVRKYAYGTEFVRDRQWPMQSVGNSRQGFQGGYGYQPDGVGAAPMGFDFSRPQPFRPGRPSRFRGLDAAATAGATDPVHGTGSITFGGNTTNFDTKVNNPNAQWEATVQKMKDQGFEQNAKNPQMFSRLTGNKYSSFEEGQKAIDAQVQKSLAAQQGSYPTFGAPAPATAPTLALKPSDTASFAPVGGASVEEFDKWRNEQDTQKFNYGDEYVEGPEGIDKVKAKLTVGEAVLTPGAAEAFGRENIAALNAAHPPQRTLARYAKGTAEVVPPDEDPEQLPKQPLTAGNVTYVGGAPSMSAAQNAANVIYERSNPVQQALSQKLNAPTAPGSLSSAPASNYLTEKVGAVVDPIRNAAGRVGQTLSNAAGAVTSKLPNISINPNGATAQILSSVADPARAVADTGKKALEYGGKAMQILGEGGQKFAVGAAKRIAPAMAAFNAGRVVNDIAEGGGSTWGDFGSQLLRDGTKMAGSTVAGTLAGAGTALTPAAPAAPAVGLAAGVGAYEGLDRLEQKFFGDSPVDKIIARNEAASPEGKEKQREAALAGAAKLGDIRDARDLRPEADALMAQQAATNGPGAPAIVAAAAPKGDEVTSVRTSGGGGDGKGQRTLQGGQDEYGEMVRNMYDQHQALLKQSLQGASWADRENARVALKYLNPTLGNAMQAGSSIAGSRASAAATLANKDWEKQKFIFEQEQKRGEENDKMFQRYWTKDKEGKQVVDAEKNEQFRRRFHSALGDQAENFYLLPKQTRDKWVEKMYKRNEMLNRANEAGSDNYKGRSSDDLLFGLAKNPNGTWLEETLGSNRMSGRGVLSNTLGRLAPGDQSTIVIGGNTMTKGDLFGDTPNQSEVEEWKNLMAELRATKKGSK